MLDFNILVIHYNNPTSLRRTVASILRFVASPKLVFIADNSDRSESTQKAKEVAMDFGCNLVLIGRNLGWGGAINYILDHCELTAEYLLVSAHDSEIKQLDLEKVCHLMDDRTTWAVSPLDTSKSKAFYSYSRGFFYKPLPRNLLLSPKLVDIGHCTAIFLRTSYLRLLRYDEEFFIYGCESEIFLRAAEYGYKTIMEPTFYVINPSTDMDSHFVITAFTINSLYCACKHGGYLGYLQRFTRVVLSALISLNKTKLFAIAWSAQNPRCGLRSYLAQQSKKNYRDGFARRAVS